MRKEENKTARRMQTAAICGCLCLLAVGAGVMLRAYETPVAETVAETAEQPVTAVKSPTLKEVQLQREQRSNDGGESPDAAPAAEKPAAKPESETAEPVFAYPLEGEIVLPYSVDHAIYDPTLEQYRTNAGISLAAAQGDTVGAAADGVVAEIREDAASGKTVVLEHANGWLTTYGQLEETVPVQEGERVKQGQAIGTVDAPTKYGVALGTHLEFAMEQNGTPQDPQQALPQAE